MMDFLSYLSETFSEIMENIYNVLPKSPFTWIARNEVVSEYIGYINYFIPIYLWISILSAWLTAIGLYYAVKIIMKWVKLE